jgi:hypothetical protein
MEGVLSEAKGDSLDQIGAEGVLEAGEDFAAAIADDFIEPRAVVDVHEKGAADHVGGLGVRGDGWVEEIVPNFEDFEVGLFFVEIDLFEDLRNDIRDRFRGRFGGSFSFAKISMAPLRQGLLFGIRFWKTFFWNGPRRAEHGRYFRGEFGFGNFNLDFSSLVQAIEQFLCDRAIWLRVDQPLKQLARESWIGF